MGKKVGNFTNPKTGSTDWLEPDTVNVIVLTPKMVIKVGDTHESIISFKLDSYDNDDNIGMIAEYSTDSQRFVSEPQKVSSEQFANDLAEAYYNEKSLDDMPNIAAMKDQAVKDLSKRMLRENVIIGGMSFDGIGFVISDNDKVISVDQLSLEYSISNNRGVKKVILDNCVGNAMLSNLDDYYIEFYTGEYKVTLIGAKITDASEGVVKKYTITVDDVKIAACNDFIEHETFDTIDFNNEDMVDLFIKSRKSLLDDTFSNKDLDEDRYGDLF